MMTQFRMFDIIRAAITVSKIQEAILGIVLLKLRNKSDILAAMGKGGRVKS